jgi:hypothetical protein
MSPCIQSGIKDGLFFLDLPDRETCICKRERSDDSMSLRWVRSVNGGSGGVADVEKGFGGGWNLNSMVKRAVLFLSLLT